MGRLRVGLMGLGSGGSQLVEVLSSSARCDLVSVGAARPHRLERFSATYPGVSTYDDLRSMIVECPLDALFIALPPHLRSQYLPLAAERAIPVWALTPPGRSLAEAVETFSAFETAKCPLVVSRWAPATAAQAHLQVTSEKPFRPHFAQGRAMACVPESLDWRGDRSRAGGGALLHLGYPLVDAIVMCMGVPANVYAVAAGISRPTAASYDTEDTASVVCQFGNGAIASIDACWTTAKPCCELTLSGEEKTYSFSSDGVTVTDNACQTTAEVVPVLRNVFATEVETFLAAVAGESEHRPAAQRGHLRALAVIEAAYLSVRTGEAESPASLLELHRLAEIEPIEEEPAV